ncbi:hypothetical protein ACP70R_012391 [Stipagrostis hirtigluma subsp. patula]
MKLLLLAVGLVALLLPPSTYAAELLAIQAKGVAFHFVRDFDQTLVGDHGEP